MDSTAAWIVGRRRVALQTESLAEMGPSDALVRTTHTAISRGTERLVLEGRVPESLRDRMRAPFQKGDFPWPVKYGYCAVGVVERAGGRAGIAEGSRVFCLHPHQDRFVVPASALVSLPEEVPSGRAVLAANLETAINAVWDGGVGPGDRVVIVGAGVVGALIAAVCARIAGIEVTLVDPLPGRKDLASRLGARFSPPERAPREADVVFHTSATAAGLRCAIDCAGEEAQIIELSWYGEGAIEAPLGASFHARRLSLRCSQVGALPPARRPRWDYRRRLSLAVSLLADPAFDALIDGESSFRDLPDALLRVTDGPGGPLCHRVVYP